MVRFGQGFPKLETLKLIGLRELQGWEIEKGAIPCLRILDIYRIPKLTMIPERLRFISSLRELNVQMSSSFVDRIRLEDGTEGEDFYKVRHIPSLSSIAVELVPTKYIKIGAHFIGETVLTKELDPRNTLTAEHRTDILNQLVETPIRELPGISCTGSWNYVRLQLVDVGLQFILIVYRFCIHGR
ncbi:hypothetical protein PanWU01x14_318710 [Parasponia andersonii]|uniref:LRR domain containing protein n=1 Tax=Parasponia andersonii TaxID=3476 RepID=A0A2P5AM62_PARAD|nr:hypothetical protein PanWU01x14_318710 [Parasponia andersonii]